MKRRDFLKTLGGGLASLVVIPSLLSDLLYSGQQQTYTFITKKKIIFVDKSRHMMYLYQRRGDSWKFDKKYVVGIGKRSGDKWREGDTKTPEGEYRIIDKMYDRNYRRPGDPYLNKLNRQHNYLYGPVAMSLNYPNDYDKKLGKTGCSIWIHGTNRPDTVGINSSNGCIKMYNKDIKDLEKRIGVGTKIIIRNRIQFARP